MQLHIPLVLASRSPRRKNLLEQLGIEFLVQESPAEEAVPADMHPRDVVQELARIKGDPVASMHPQALTLAADTVVVLDDVIIGKPTSPAAARKTLRSLSGRSHRVYTGFALMHPVSERSAVSVEETKVGFGNITDEEIERYVSSGAPMDKAGSYGIQDDWGAVFVRSIEGDYNNVVGLPLYRLYRVLRDTFPDAVEL